MLSPCFPVNLCTIFNVVAYSAEHDVVQGRGVVVVVGWVGWVGGVEGEHAAY